jgi:hypothetical protein
MSPIIASDERSGGIEQSPCLVVDTPLVPTDGKFDLPFLLAPIPGDSRAGLDLSGLDIHFRLQTFE